MKSFSLKSFSSPTPRLIAEASDGVGVISINNSEKRNALDLAMWRALPQLIAAMATDDAVRVIVLRGVGGSPFASGADISEFRTLRASAAGGKAYEESNEEAFAAIAACPVPVIAMMRGFCMGGGVGIAAACDLRVAAQGTVFGVPAARLGVGYPPKAMRLVVAAFGDAVARDLFFTARRLDAAEAKALGALHRLWPDADLEAETMAMARAIAGNAPLAMRSAKASIAAASGLPGSVSEAELLALAGACFDSDDYAEGRDAFLEKRQPQFQGR